MTIFLMNDVVVMGVVELPHLVLQHLQILRVHRRHSRHRRDPFLHPSRQLLVPAPVLVGAPGVLAGAAGGLLPVEGPVELEISDVPASLVPVLVPQLNHAVGLLVGQEVIEGYDPGG
eukprot:CAMPEP_0183324468 /NCGR_PEP_ID=MMETSP0160_2-20130417/77094_1 /TAXON_ID=2839 ORGANISM="Odontella Sinensis, Strain Grunow 1884" /NCGR_SAMPLE_ID=MMETSP0160_2 /ASSEMBLY_ACC=CAM_ASM_000250 /LENGTH=116 /DNA_ID=CAMNT_0025492057 /DNA_START=623 /DNA_END=970 /DNA_ORIENTATION=+